MYCEWMSWVNYIKFCFFQITGYVFCIINIKQRMQIICNLKAILDVRLQILPNLWNIFKRREGFPCGSAGKESTCDTGDLGWIPGLGGYPGEGKGYPFPYSGLENSIDCIVHAVTKSRTQLSDFHFQENVSWNCYLAYTSRDGTWFFR